MKKIRNLFLLLCSLVLMCCSALPAFAADGSAAQPAASVQEPAADSLNRKQIAFIVIDGTGSATARMRELWQRQVRQAYPRAKYTFISDPQVLLKGRDAILTQGGGSVDESVLAAAADAMGADVVAVTVVNAMQEYYVQPFFLDWDDGPETYIQAVTSANLYLYKKDGDKFRKKSVRKVETQDIALTVHPYVEIQHALSDFARSFEGLPLI